MQKVKAIGSIVVIGEHVLHPDRFTHFPDGVPVEVAERTDLVEIVDGDAPALTPVLGMTADGVDKTGAVGCDGTGGDINPAGGAGNGDTTNPGAGDDSLGGVTLLRVDDDEAEDEGGASAPTPDPFGDDTPATLDTAPPARTSRATIRTSSGGRR
ncbi:MAG: hypothetical protein WC326_16220 [Candidatus Delongbacteria bacterium]